ncbi:phosphate ABC transporter substrate-binding protein [Desulfovibrio mangrovi]|uniref:phosphate ABC transporter substrate-binding protein n=1 Tax=Desulfovibrio mangrovi TaxID=2976983 RepID=UPI002246B3FE|nr:phosphate ABC transporter substrate-binding protein [Desulfovibrio mangrovi]UZP69207.1 phosphate ABC transporter substrate-binding protein [Desulfovibrio mangrovi]
MVVCLTLALTVTASLSWASPLDAFKGKQGTVDIAGGTAHIPVMKEAAKRIMTANPEVRISIAGGGSGVGVQQVGEGLVHIGNTGRGLSSEEVAKYGLVSFAFAIDGVAVVINPANGIDALTAAQVKDIYAGKIANWKELGGEDRAITLYTRDEASGTREVFFKKLLAKGDIAASANVVPSNGAMKTAIAQDPGAIGYVGIGHIDSTVKAPSMDGMVPTQENAANGTYTITRKLFMNTKGEPQGVVKDFIEYIFTPEGAEIIRASGYIPVSK